MGAGHRAAQCQAKPGWWASTGAPRPSLSALATHPPPGFLRRGGREESIWGEGGLEGAVSSSGLFREVGGGDQVFGAGCLTPELRLSYPSG